MPVLTPKIDWVDIFGNTQPVEVVLGCGRGRFCLDRATAEPHINFLGLDYAAKYLRVGQARAEKRKLENVQFVQAELATWLLDLPSESVSVFHMYFPDPWPKRRHNKRRTITADFLRLLHEKLQPEGLIEMATDDVPYYAQIREAVAGSEIAWAQVRESHERFAFEAFKTSYEQKYEQEGRQLHFLELVKP